MRDDSIHWRSSQILLWFPQFFQHLFDLLRRLFIIVFLILETRRMFAMNKGKENLGLNSGGHIINRENQR